MVFIVLLSDSPRCRLGEALEDLPPGQYRFCPPGPGQGIPYPPGRTVAVLSDQMAEPPLAPPRLPAGCPIIFSGQNLAAAQFARSSGLTPLDCGLSLRDTLTLSSLTSRSAVISLQRPVARLDGALAEPGDIPLPLSREWAPFPLLCRAGVLLLSGGTAALDPNLF